MKKISILLSLCGSFLSMNALHAQQQSSFLKDRKIALNEDGSNFLKFSFLTQAWIRSSEYNPGTTIDGTPKSSGTDIGVRRASIQIYGQLTDRVFAYTQIGMNNYNNISDRKQGFFIHDAYGEYAIDKRALSLGMGLSGWSGLSRFASPSVGSQLGIDAPIYQQQTNDVTDQFLRKLSIFAKGKIGKLDYRVQMAQPMSIKKMAGYNPTITPTANFSSEPAKMQFNGYVQYQFLEEESNQTPYFTGTYLGKKRVLNIGAGITYQKDAMWRLNEANDTVKSNMVHIAGDIFYDAPIGNKGEAISAYANVTHSDFGKDYIRNSGVMNPANGNNDPSVLNGAGVAFPMYGTGTTYYAQVGYKLKDNLIGKTTLMPYASLQHSDYKALNDAMNFWDFGVNWLLAGHGSKLTVSYRNHPVYNTSGDKTTTRNAILAQYQISF